MARCGGEEDVVDGAAEVEAVGAVGVVEVAEVGGEGFGVVEHGGEVAEEGQGVGDCGDAFGAAVGRLFGA